ncbi:alanyl-tRNA editing protein [Pseudothermotoga thermarum]|uniref:Threonyl/alanyl tRNA synthetase SAD n=1 Tax=Pseudothermotoga thermarum DSM 5069 TaxID=688269 RepID=F7YY34_9THEM|nr:alanyl-tRNA editing protein [Pseudothermotoga thermarum]AEH50844.1 Threonyl/alanyl tRNA synthetase SAD [Pseudothermotoga thermarum DSM 5069]
MIKIEQVLQKDGKIFAVSSESPFYPDGKGGQLGDRGHIGDAKVFFVKESEGKFFHQIDRFIEPGEYPYQIDMERRKDIAAQHTAQHVLSAAFLKVADVQTVSFRMSEEFSTIDLDVPTLTHETLSEAEALANEVIRSCVQVEIINTTKEQANRMNLRKPLSEKVEEGFVRLVKIGDFDLSACAGFHVTNTGEIGCVKVVDWEKVKGSLTRVYFVAAERALKDYGKRVLVLKQLSTLLTSSIDEMVKRVESLLDKTKEQAGLIEKLAEALAVEQASKLPEIKIKDFKVAFYDGIDEVARFLPKYCSTDVLVCKTSEGYTISTKTIDCSKLVQILSKEFNCSGGGGKTKGSLKTSVKLEHFIESLSKVLEVIQ